MRAAVTGALLLVFLTACGKKIEKHVQETVSRFDNALLSSDQVEVTSVRRSGDQALAEIKVTTAVKMVKRKGKWEIEEIRIGDRRWEKAEHILAFLNQKRAERTLQHLNELSEAIERYAQQNGTPPEAKSYQVLVDVLAANYLSRVIRIDAWSNPFQYRALAGAGYDLRSAGADGKFGTPDDLVAGKK